MTTSRRNQGSSPSSNPAPVEYVIHYQEDGVTRRKPFKTRLEAESEVARLRALRVTARYVGAFTKDKDGVVMLYRGGD